MSKKTYYKDWHWFDFAGIRLRIKGLTDYQINNLILKQLPIENNKPTYLLIIKKNRRPK